jgi:hypothetical protein
MESPSKHAECWGLSLFCPGPGLTVKMVQNHGACYPAPSLLYRTPPLLMRLGLQTLLSCICSPVIWSRCSHQQLFAKENTRACRTNFCVQAKRTDSNS